jgi:multidrug resistance efflux pump
MTVIRAQVPRQWIGYGTAVAVSSAEIPSRVTATVAEIPSAILRGAAVNADDLIVRLDDADFRAEAEMASDAIKAIAAERALVDVERASLTERVRLAEQELEIARADEARVARAAEELGATEREVDRARTQRIAAERAKLLLAESLEQCGPRERAIDARRSSQEASLRRAQDAVSRCRITSPIRGTLGRFDLRVGESVAAGASVARVVDDSRVEVPIALSASARASVRIGDAVTLIAAGREVARSTVARINPEDDPADRTLLAYTEIDRTKHGVDAPAPGAFVEAIVEARDAEPRTVVPRRSVRNERVLILEADQLRPVSVRVAHAYRGRVPGAPIDDQEWLVLAEPLPEGTTIALDGARLLRPGRRVEGEFADATRP